MRQLFIMCLSSLFGHQGPPGRELVEAGIEERVAHGGRGGASE